MAIGETNKRKVLNELEESYKKKGMTEYAPRLGELLAITTFFQVSSIFFKNYKILKKMHAYKTTRFWWVQIHDIKCSI